MQLTIIKPLCDKDLARMSQKELSIESPGEAQIIYAYVCGAARCTRCYNEAAGYFDFISGKPTIETRQKLCTGDAHPMFLELVTGSGEEIWRCPHCGDVSISSSVGT